RGFHPAAGRAGAGDGRRRADDHRRAARRDRRRRPRAPRHPRGPPGSAAWGGALVATRGGRMVARLEADGGRLAQMPVQTKNPLVMLGNAARLVSLIRQENVSIVHARSRAPAFSALWAAKATRTPFVATYHGAYRPQSGLQG